MTNISAYGAISRIAGLGSDKKRAEEMLKQIDFAKEYRRRREKVSPETLNEEDFAAKFAVRLSVIAAGHLHADDDGLAVIALHHVIDPHEPMTSDMLFDADCEDEETRERIFAMLCGLSIIEQVEDGRFPYENADDEAVTAVYKRHVKAAILRYESSPMHIMDLSMEDAMTRAVRETETLSGILTVGHVNDWFADLIQQEAIIGSDAPEITPDVCARICTSAANSAKTLGLSRDETYRVMSTAIDHALSGIFGGVTALADLPAASMTGEEENAEGIAAHFASCAVTLLRAGGDIIEADFPTYAEIAEECIGPMIAHLQHREDEDATSLDLARMTLSCALSIYNAKLDLMYDDGLHNVEDVTQMMIDTFMVMSEEDVDHVFTNGEVMEHPGFQETVAYRGALTALTMASDAALKRVRAALGDHVMAEHDVPAGKLWTLEEPVFSTWKDAVQTAKSMATPAGIRYVIIPVMYGDEVYVLFHNGKRHLLLDVARETFDQDEDRGSVH